MTFGISESLQRCVLFLQDFVGVTDPKSSRILMTKQADWAKSSKEPRAAAEMYLSAGEHLKAIDIIGEHGWADMYVSVTEDKLSTMKYIVIPCCGTESFVFFSMQGK